MSDTAWLGGARAEVGGKEAREHVHARERASNAYAPNEQSRPPKVSHGTSRSYGFRSALHLQPAAVQLPFGHEQLFKHCLFSHARPLKPASQTQRETGNSTRHQPCSEQRSGQSRIEQSSPINGGAHWHVP